MVGQVLRKRASRDNDADEKEIALTLRSVVLETERYATALYPAVHRSDKLQGGGVVRPKRDRPLELSQSRFVITKAVVMKYTHGDMRFGQIRGECHCLFRHLACLCQLRFS